MSADPLAQQGKFLAAALERARAGLAHSCSASVRAQHMQTVARLEALLERVELAAVRRR